MNVATAQPAELSEVTPPNGDVLYEVVNGQYRELPPMSAFEVSITSVLAEYLAPHARAKGLGRVRTEMLFAINPASRLQRRPDLAFLSYQRWARERPVPTT